MPQDSNPNQLSTNDHCLSQTINPRLLREVVEHVPEKRSKGYVPAFVP